MLVLQSSLPTGFEWMGSGDGSGVFLLKSLRLFNILLSRQILLGLKINSLQYFDNKNMQYFVFEHCMHHSNILHDVFKA